jgi:hypothetical protein
MLTCAEMIDIGYDPLFEKAVPEDQGYVGVVTCPAEEVCTSTDEEVPYRLT